MSSRSWSRPCQYISEENLSSWLHLACILRSCPWCLFRYSGRLGCLWLTIREGTSRWHSCCDSTHSTYLSSAWWFLKWRCAYLWLRVFSFLLQIRLGRDTEFSGQGAGMPYSWQAHAREDRSLYSCTNHKWELKYSHSPILNSILFHKNESYFCSLNILWVS